MSSINYFNLYSLDFSHLERFVKRIESLEDELKTPLQNACNGASAKSNLEKNQKQLNFLKLIPVEGKTVEFVKDLENASLMTQTLLDQFAGSDPYLIQDLVHRILGISQNTEDQSITFDLRQKYFDLMKQTGFLITDYTEIDSISYDTGALTTSYLENHTDVKTMTLGCGKVTFSGPACCQFRRATDHDQESFKIDLTANSGPDVVANMHDTSLWTAIPNEQFTAVLDHSFGYFLFEDEHSTKTINQIFRTLKPGGYLEMDHPFRDENIVLLKEAGFVLNAEKPKVAIKPNLNGNTEREEGNCSIS